MFSEYLGHFHSIALLQNPEDSEKVPTGKLRKCMIDKLRVRWIEADWQSSDGCDQQCRAWWPSSDVPQESVLDLILFSIFINYLDEGRMQIDQVCR